MTTAKSGDEVRREILGRIVGQDEAVDAIVDMYSVAAAGLTPPGRVPGSMILLGPTGVGKTELVRALAMALHGDSDKMVRIDCGEYTNSHEVAKLIGAPPGYLGHRETTPRITRQKVAAMVSCECPFSIFLFDEIEKAAESMRELLLGVLGRANLALGDGTDVDFGRSLVFFTSNVGSVDIARRSRGGIGFTSHGNSVVAEAMAALKRSFTPEFINRIDFKVPCRQISRQDAYRVVEIEMREVKKVAEIERKCEISLSNDVIEAIVERGYSPEYGAREIQRAIRELVTIPIARRYPGWSPIGHVSISMDGNSPVVELVQPPQAQEEVSTSNGRTTRKAA